MQRVTNRQQTCCGLNEQTFAHIEALFTNRQRIREIIHIILFVLIDFFFGLYFKNQQWQTAFPSFDFSLRFLPLKATRRHGGCTPPRKHKHVLHPTTAHTQGESEARLPRKPSRAYQPAPRAGSLTYERVCASAWEWVCVCVCARQ